VLLNTSFNRHEPIVASPQDAIRCFLATKMDVLVLGDFYTTDRGGSGAGGAAAASSSRPQQDAALPAS
jgi:hypothetical protein